jgi:glycosyltransferase involved in cell wall biosynthesis
MKVLLFSSEWPEYMIGMANALSKHCKIVLMLPHNYGLTGAHRKCIDKDVTLKTFEFIDFKSIRRNTTMLWNILGVLWKEQPDVLHIQANGFRLFFWVALLKPLKTKIVNTIHDPEKHSGDLLSLAVDDSQIVYLMRFFTRKYIVHGEQLIGELARAYSVSRDKIVSIPHGHFEIYKQFQKEQANETTFNVLFFGRIWPYKGLDYFIEAANIVHREHPGIEFCIAGTGENIEKYTALIQHPDLFRVINRKIPNEEVGLLFQKASVVILPYIDATQSGVIPLAYAYAKPVIATNVGGLSEVVKDGQTGFLVQPRSAQQIAEKIFFLIHHHADKVRMGEQAYAFAHNELSWERIAFLTFSIYSDL